MGCRQNFGFLGRRGAWGWQFRATPHAEPYCPRDQTSGPLVRGSVRHSVFRGRAARLMVRGFGFMWLYVAGLCVAKGSNRTQAPSFLHRSP